MTLYRSALPAVVIFFYGSLLSVGVLGFQEVYDNILYGLGILPGKELFVDGHAILSAAQCHRLGVNIFISNPCDVLNRPFNYSPLWLFLVPPFMTTEHTPVIGVAFNLMFVAALYAVLRPTSWRELTCLAVACTSTAVTFAVERANVDLFIFALAALAVIFWGRGPIARLGAYAICFFAGLLKFYPFVLLTISLREPPKRFMKIATTANFALLAFIVCFHDEILNAVNLVPTGIYFDDRFGARNLPFGIAQLRSNTIGAYKAALTYSILLTAVAVCLAIAIFVVRYFDAKRIIIDWTTHEARCLLVGSLLIVSCFFAGQNIGYRGTHLLFVLFGLLAIRRSAVDLMLRRVLFFTIAAVLFLMWEEGIRHSFEFLLRQISLRDKIPAIPSQIFWVMRELTWWWVVSVLTAMVALFVIQSPSARAVVSIWTSRKPRSPLTAENAPCALPKA